MLKKYILILISVLTAALYGCGGSSSDEDTTSPTVTAVSPANDASCVARSSVIKATFSEAMGASFINRTTFTIKRGGNRIAGTVNYGGISATFIPFPNLTTFTTYTAILTTGAKDSNGNALLSDYVWSFRTGGATDLTKSFADDVQPIFNDHCIVCHSSTGSASSILRLTSDVAFSNLVNKQSQYSGILVIACDSANSVLYKRVSETSAGAQMPKGGTPLSSTYQNSIKTWIDEGALDN